ncbi:heterokaryon incompatibility protein-domain-containing protein [Hypoxylon rubiginosum]|uniref:Heterokaryon incompatibility protein-domain-containing protein n=1 Tax=Hypoxylon rubiginosum TaxID=110542 RepID=A0ACB9YZC9_9PEZI|nr:heterokaryon incompatibility protein-domain-containing protein [Hypoxylon rubiginosum]
MTQEEKVVVKIRKSKTWNLSGTIYVRSNLFVALKRFRRQKKPVTMWINALCIDQDDLTERSEQVKKMHELYLQAENVSIWLGDGTSEGAPNPQDCFQFLEDMLDLKNLDRFFGPGSEDDVDNAVNIVSLMCNKWFSRRWVLQELALARKAEVVYGKRRMPWSDFADAISIFHQELRFNSPHRVQEIRRESCLLGGESP